jgi:Ca-activated chloride channel family protein
MSYGSAMPMAAPMAMPSPMTPSAPPPPSSGAAPEQYFLLREAPGAGSGGVDLGGLMSAPLDAARGLARHLRPGRRSRSDRAAGSGGGTSFHAEESAPSQRGGLTAVFSGTPHFSGGEAVLFDSRDDRDRLPAGGTLARLVLRLGGAPGAPLDAGLTIALYVDDLTAPRARARLADLIRPGGERPLNVRYQPGQVVRIVLLDPHGAWAAGAPPLEVALG